MTFQVLVQNPAGETLRWELDKASVYVGRLDGNDIRLTQPFVSGLHLLIERRAGSFSVKDLGSTEGTLLHGEVIEPHVDHPWRFGEAVQIGNLLLRLEPSEDETLVEVLPGQLLARVDSAFDRGAQTRRGPSPKVNPDDVVDAVPTGPGGTDFAPVEPPPTKPLPWGLILQILAGFVVLAGVMLAVVTLLL